MLIIVDVLVMGIGGLLIFSSMYIFDSPTHLEIEMREPELENIKGHLSARCFAEQLHKSSYSFLTVAL